MDSVATARSSRLRSKHLFELGPAGAETEFRAAFCRILAPLGRGTRRLRNKHAGFPPTIHSRGRWLRDLGGSRSSGRGTCRRGGSCRAWPLSRKIREKRGVTPDARASIQERQVALFASEASAMDSGSRSPRRGDGGNLGIGLRFDGAVSGTGFQFCSAVEPPWRPGSFQKSSGGGGWSGELGALRPGRCRRAG